MAARHDIVCARLLSLPFDTLCQHYPSLCHLTKKIWGILDRKSLGATVPNKGYPPAVLVTDILPTAVEPMYQVISLGIDEIAIDCGHVESFSSRGTFLRCNSSLKKGGCLCYCIIIFEARKSKAVEEVCPEAVELDLVIQTARFFSHHNTLSSHLFNFNYRCCAFT